MAKKTPPQAESPEPVVPRTGLQPVNIAEEMRTAYLDYAMSVITARDIKISSYIKDTFTLSHCTIKLA
jgi:hypothetical protein